MVLPPSGPSLTNKQLNYKVCLVFSLATYLKNTIANTYLQLHKLLKISECLRLLKNTLKIDASIITHKLEDDGQFYMYLFADSTLRASQVFSTISDNLSWTSISLRLLSVITQAVLKKIRFS